MQELTASLYSFAALAATAGKPKNGWKDPLILGLHKSLKNDRGQHFFFSAYLYDVYGQEFTLFSGLIREILQNENPRDKTSDHYYNMAGVYFSRMRDIICGYMPSSALNAYGLEI